MTQPDPSPADAAGSPTDGPAAADLRKNLRLTNEGVAEPKPGKPKPVRQAKPQRSPRKGRERTLRPDR